MSQNLRENEVAVTAAPPTDAALRFIGHIRTPFTSRALCPRQGRPDGPECRLVLRAPWAAGLAGLERFEFAEVLYWLHESRRDLVLQSPKSDGAVRGVFSLRSPVRPNPIGLARVAILRIEGPEVIVRGLDCLDGTPLIDLKPDHCAYTVAAPDKPADRAP
ncbi:tRNA (N6-threonylcarbamoyladenosine(37)-N6)-methyltransferase TrmO [Marinovum sp.]|uniref:tRNA (N6-threonylcarbamoyladenosine(37)-N6)-methyltransferase TrmO n=1 Tax=Marinovum sp. TaxID=2024839 RepID=UPI002B26E1A3|nr:tRNA (N6-threonylcarbamoyladenosine(37)-N6)-methyltransferase TrmO [Marinovum sp.]